MRAALPHWSLAGRGEALLFRCQVSCPVGFPVCTLRLGAGWPPLWFRQLRVLYACLWVSLDRTSCHLRQISECQWPPGADMQDRPGCPGLFTALSWPQCVPRWPSSYTWEPPRSPASSLALLPPSLAARSAVTCLGPGHPVSSRPGTGRSLAGGAASCSGRAGRSAPGNQLWLHRRSWQGCRTFLLPASLSLFFKLVKIL